MTTQWVPKRSLAEVDAILTQPGQMHELENRIIGKRNLRVYKHQPPSLRAFWLSTAPFADKDYLVYLDQRYTYKRAHDRVAEIANLLKSYGIVKGDRVGICSRNYPEFILTFWAIAVVGAIVVPINAWLPLDSLIHCITLTNSRVLFVDLERAHVLSPSIPQLQLHKVIVFQAASVLASLSLGGMMSFDTALLSVKGKTIVPEVTIDPEDMACIFFTSGTTGLPKGVASTQRQYLTNLMNAAAGNMKAILRRGDDIPAPDPLAHQKGLLLLIPCFHATAMQSFITLITAVGGKAVLAHKFDVKECILLLKVEKLTTTGGDDDDCYIESLGYGGAPGSKNFPVQFSKKFPNATAGLSQGYGLTETNAIVTALAAEDSLLRPTSCGSPALVNDIKIVNMDTNVEEPIGTAGEVLIKGPNVASFYWNNPQATEEAFSEDGWFKSGDIGYLDEEGFLFLVDRAKDIIIRGGENISSITVENAIYSDARVADVSVVGVPDERYGELVAAIVVPRAEFASQITESEIMEIITPQLPRHCLPVMILFSNEELPRNANGKTIKKDLKVHLGKIWEARNMVKAKL